MAKKPNAYLQKQDQIRQKELDGHLGEIWGEDMCPFFERYPYVKKIGYNKPQNGWVDHE